jgi:WhiB family redox-sensing transcriptional regulator
MKDWRHQAACVGEDPELFFPLGSGESSRDQIAQAKAVCDRCPVVGDCLAWALATGQGVGVWGGLDEDERRALAQRNARTRVTA